MQDVVYAFTGSAYRGSIAQIHFAKVDLVIVAGQIRCLARQIVIYAPNFFPAFYQGSRQGRSNKTRDSSNKIFRHRRSGPTLKIAHPITQGDYSSAQKPVCPKSTDILWMYFWELNFLPVEAPDIYRIVPKIGRSNQGRSNLPTIDQAIPAYPLGSLPSRK